MSKDTEDLKITFDNSVKIWYAQEKIWQRMCKAYTLKTRNQRREKLKMFNKLRDVPYSWLERLKFLKYDFSPIDL